MWYGQSGRLFFLQDLKGSDHLNCLHGIFNFNSRSAAQNYNKTLFRLPLRSTASDLSSKVYTMQSINKLIDALRSEAKLLLLFLRSVHTIEVYKIDGHGNKKLTLQVKVADAFVAEVKQKRASFLRDLKYYHASYHYNFSEVIQFVAKFDVSVYDANTRHTSTSHWLVANQVGSSSPTVRAAAVKQKVFPWVGTAVELDSPGNGRIFCFLPMPIETDSNLPVHVNGTFGLNNDRRSLKWPEVERRNDLMADWNKMLVTEVLPSCYVCLLLQSKGFLSPKNFYSIWPSVKSLKGSQWGPLLSLVLKSIHNKAVILSKGSEWVIPSKAVLVGKNIVPVVDHVLTRCGVKLAEVPVSVKNAFAYGKVHISEVSPKLVRNCLRQNAHSYSNIKAKFKRQLLEYCLSDDSYNDLADLKLLPLCDGSFHAFVRGTAKELVYLCTERYPRCLFPNLNHKLVDSDEILEPLAVSNFTQLRPVTLTVTPTLIMESIPTQFKALEVIPFPNASKFPPKWFKLFWTWVQDKPLNGFADNFIMPVLKEDVSTPGHFNVVKLNTQQPILYIPKKSTCSELALTVLRKFKILCCVQKSCDFSFVAHKDLKKYTNSFDSNGILKSMSCYSSYPNVTLMADEAACLRKLLCDPHSPISSDYYYVLSNLKIFTSASNSNGVLYSVKDARSKSILNAVIILEASHKLLFDLSVLPAGIILFTSDEQYQKKLLRLVKSDSFMSEATLLTAYIFHCISEWTIPRRSISRIMIEVLEKFDILKYHDSSIPDKVKNLSFVATSSGTQKCPKDLYDPDIAELHHIFYDAPVFPSAPYDKPQYISALRNCGLRTIIVPQELLDVILKICKPAQLTPQSVDAKKFACAKAILKYIGTSDHQSSSILCSLPSAINHGSLPFSSALDLLSFSKCWLPVLSSRPSGYPSQLPWKGEEFTSHLCSLDPNVCISSTSKPSHYLIYGSQVYFTDPVIESDILTSQVSPCHLVAHLQEVVSCAQHLNQRKLLHTVKIIYSAMLEVVRRGNTAALSSLRSVKEWIYLKDHKKFVSPDNVALSVNPTFRHNLEPYLHKLPDSISDYSELFTAFGVSEEMSESHIISVLSAMREDIYSDVTSISVDECWSVVMAILNWLTENGATTYHGCLDSLYIPIESDSKWLDLQPASEVVYTDNEFFKKFTIASETEKPLKFLHCRVNVTIAECLQLTPLSKELDIVGDTFEDTGQYEPLTTRLKNILRDYKDGLTIVKELIQNADDAEATEVSICFDARTHCQDTSKLFFPGMSQSHGPALVIHNNTVFSDEDFENITKLAGGTKQKKHLKIGKFGIGFCSVYHITDIPSFVSRDRLYIFDPTLAHLGKEIKNPALPGKKLQFTSRIIQNSKQLDPYDNLYQFSRAESYNGTMFRLPFRTSASELSGKCYTEATALELLDDIYNCSESLILFLQHVRTITYKRIGHREKQPTTLFSVHRKDISLMKTIAQQGISTVSIESEMRSDAKSSKWLVSRHSTYSGNKYAVASVACEISSDSLDEYSVNELLRGEVFCFLPLSQSTGLPVHVSCNFAVINNRRGIWTAEESASTADEAEVGWNIFLMENIIPKAYLGLLCAIKKMHEVDVLDMYDFYDLWPLHTKLVQQNPWSRFVFQLYQELSSASLFYCESQKEWRSLKQSRFLQQSILNISEPQRCIMDVLLHLGLPIVELPEKYRTYFKLNDLLIDELNFIRIFFSDLLSLTDIHESRNTVILAMLDTYAAQSDYQSKTSQLLHEFMSSEACIPCSPDGKELRKCSKLIHPKAKFAKLYDEDEGMFPFKEMVNRNLPEVAMKNLCLIQTSIPWDYVVERALTVQTLMKSDSANAYHRIKYIIEAITSHTGSTEPNTVPSLRSIDFLPVMKKPRDFPLKWPGDGITLSSGEEMMLCGHKKSNLILAGSQSKFVNEDRPQYEGCGHISSRAKTMLGLIDVPTLSTTINHLIVIITESDKLACDWISKACKSAYASLDTHMQDLDFNDSELLMCRRLKDLPCIWNGKRFIHRDQVSFGWSLDGPYLFKVPAILSSKKKLCNSLDIKEVFSIDDIRNGLERMAKDFKRKPVDHLCQKVIQQLVPLLQDIEDQSLRECSFLLPDEKFHLHRSEDLAYNDAPWAPPDQQHIYVNDIIPRGLAQKLGVRPVRSRFLDKYSSVPGFKGGVAFGQREDLTRRIQNILSDYPLDVTLLKELLQNADDAKATKMYVILDKRFHNTTSILSEEWGDLQGPAMLVWNDSVFSEKDFEGIQELGLGSKRSEADTIGQYGIGFNVVYHITDCPSFVSNGETLCILDPHCRYTPGANELSPGRRFDKLSNGFWQDFPDMKSAYLRGGVTNMPSEVQQGSLLRLPIRHSRRKITSSQIIDGVKSSKPCLSARELHTNLKKWLRTLKEAMLFLDSVEELKFFVIQERKNQMVQEFHFKSECEVDRNKLHNQQPFVITYPLTLTEICPTKQVDKWLIQQGVGDIYNENCEWKYISSMKPLHGIAAPVSQKDNFEGQVFSFLPLPVQSGFPVHVNGRFILSSTRQDLWKCTDIGSVDDQSKWNENLIQALASSYANFLFKARVHYILAEYNALQAAVDAIDQYYSLFPAYTEGSTYWGILARALYQLVVEHNHPIFCSLAEKTVGKYSINWYPPNSATAADHVYCWPSHNYSSDLHEDVYPVFERVGMKITPAPSRVVQQFNAELTGPKISPVSKKSVFEYYTKHSSSAQGLQPTKIQNTVFQSVKSFVLFTKYILSKDANYPNSPFNHFLLLTADGVLRKFEHDCKVLVSRFFGLFKRSQSRFLHPSLLGTNYSKAYFIQPVDDSDGACLILQIVEDFLPPQLKNVPMIADATAVINYDDLCSLWKCFAEDKVFKKHTPNIMQKWPLLPSQDNRLFSTTSNIIPVNNCSADLRDYENTMNKVMQKISMPFLDTIVVGAAAVDCPSLSDWKRILSNVYHIHQKTSLKTELDNSDLDSIIDYLKHSGMIVSKVCKQVKSLPLFESVDGSYTSIWDNKAYVWPDEACDMAYQKWLEGHDAVFIKSNGKWVQLGSTRQLAIQEVSLEEIYIRFIFPHFYKMSTKEGYEHLKYIRDYLYDTNVKYCKMAYQSEKRKIAAPFLDALNQLECIPYDASLHQISSFCDHTIDIFKAFPDDFLFLPEEYCDRTWLTFFQDLGLQQTVSEEKFFQFLQKTASSDVSGILLEYLFIEGQEWDSSFLEQVMEIPFVFPAPIPRLSWVVPGDFPADQMVKLKGSASVSRADLLWTLKPSIRLPKSSSIDMKETLCITTDPKGMDVVKNIQNICENSPYIQQDLFANYPQRLHCPQGKDDLLKIFSRNLGYLNKLSAKDDSDFSILQSLPCIPVYHTTGRDASVNCLVLVKPCQVLHATWIDSEVKKFHPFLHCLPKELHFISQLLKDIGVKISLELSHIQVVLKMAYEATADSELDINTQNCVKLAIGMLDELLKPYQQNLDDAAALLSPLYLPDSENKLKPSKSLLYGDTIDYWGNIELDLKGTPYFHFDIKLADYKCNPHDLCRLLPESVRPIGLSTVIKQKMVCKPQITENSDFARQLLESIKLSIVPKAIGLFISKYTDNEKLEHALIERAKKYLDAIEVTTVSDLKTQIFLKESGKLVGSMTKNFQYTPGKEKSMLYFDSDLVSADDVYLSVSNHLCGMLCQPIKPTLTLRQETQISGFIKDCLLSQSEGKVQQLLLKKGITLDQEIREMHTVTKKLGEEVPVCWHHRLEQDIDNVFNPMEYVGYEGRECHIVISQIVHPLCLQDVAEMKKYYKIYTRDDDPDGENVSFLCLYKFLVSSRMSKHQAGAGDIVLHERTKGRVKSKTTDFLEIKKKICKQLNQIWELPLDLRSKALRRLYLRWHPDKNENPDEAEKIFKFLMKQIEHLEKGEPLESPNVEVAAEMGSFFRKTGGGKFYYRSKYSSSFNFERWDNTAHSHSSASSFEHSFFSYEDDDRGRSLSVSTPKRTKSDYFPFDKQENERKPDEGRRWVNQASTEFKILQHSYKQADLCSGYGYVCFLAHQVAEKSLKGGVYALCGMDGRSINDHDHNLSRHAYALQAAMPDQTKGLAQHCITLESYYLDTRYPNRWPDHSDTPCEHYTQKTALQAQKHAKSVLDTVISLMH